MKTLGAYGFCCMTRDLYLQVKEVDIVEEPISIFSRNFVLYVAKTSTYKRFNNAFGGSINFAPTDKSGFRVYDYGAKRCR